MTDFVSVVIPVFNRRSRLERAARSVLVQKHSNLELIVVDDASTIDLSSSRDQMEAQNDSGKIRWLRLDENSGPAAARNAGVALARGDWIAFLDSDDLWHPDKLTSQIAWHRKNPDIRISQVRDQWIRNGKELTKPSRLEQTAGDLFQKSLDHCAIGPSCVMIRRDLWEEEGGFDPWFRVCEDYELWLRITCREPIGLAGAQPLAVKRGGYGDQLSTSVPALDRYRFVALGKLLHSEKARLTDEQRIETESELMRRAGILAQGAAKRNRTEWQSFYESFTVPITPELLDQARRYAKCEI